MTYGLGGWMVSVSFAEQFILIVSLWEQKKCPRLLLNSTMWRIWTVSSSHFILVSPVKNNDCGVLSGVYSLVTRPLYVRSWQAIGGKSMGWKILLLLALALDSPWPAFKISWLGKAFEWTIPTCHGLILQRSGPLSKSIPWPWPLPLDHIQHCMESMRTFVAHSDTNNCFQPSDCLIN